MAWALVNEVEMPLSRGKWDETGEYIQEIISVPSGTVMNLIVYDGVSKYNPPPGYILKQINNEQIGDFVGL